MGEIGWDHHVFAQTAKNPREHGIFVSASVYNTLCAIPFRFQMPSPSREPFFGSGGHRAGAKIKFDRWVSAHCRVLALTGAKGGR
jgi:hypothetical protein